MTGVKGEKESVFRIGNVNLTTDNIGAEPAITTGTTLQYWRGDKTFRDFMTDVRATTITAPALTNSAIAADDTLQIAAGKLQAQVNAVITNANGREPAVAAGTASQYWRGDKSWVDFATSVRGATITAPTLNYAKEIYFMGKKLKSTEELISGYSQELLKYYLSWKDIYDNGCTDPGYSDGVNIDQERAHIMISKERLEEIIGDKFHLYPDWYFYPTPPRLPFKFMAKDREFLGASEDEKKCNKALSYAQVMSFNGKKLVLFNRSYDAVKEEKKRQEKIREEMGARLYTFFLKDDGDEADIRFLTEEPITFEAHTVNILLNRMTCQK
jgi:hypothetical protein